MTDTSSIDQTTCNGSLTCQAWQSPDSAAAWAVRVLGETQHQTCDGCTTTQTTPGVGLAPLIQETYNTKLQSLQVLVSGAQPITPENLQAAGSPAMAISRGVIEALRDEQDQGILTQRLASEVALSTVLEQALTLQRTCLQAVMNRTWPQIGWLSKLSLTKVMYSNRRFRISGPNWKFGANCRRTLRWPSSSGGKIEGMLLTASTRAIRRETDSTRYRSKAARQIDCQWREQGTAATPALSLSLCLAVEFCPTGCGCRRKYCWHPCCRRRK